MDLIWIIYLVDTFAGDPLPTYILFIALVTLGMSLFFSGLAYSVSVKENTTELEDINNFSKGVKESTIILTAAKYCSIFILIFSSINSLIPSKDTAYKMLAAYGVAELSKDEKVRELGDKSLKVLEKAMDKYLKEDVTTEIKQ